MRPDEEFKFYPKPWRFVEATGCSGARVEDANGNAILSLYWPVHTPEEEQKAVDEVYEIGRAIAETTQLKAELDKARAERDAEKREREAVHWCWDKAMAAMGYPDPQKMNPGIIGAAEKLAAERDTLQAENERLYRMLDLAGAQNMGIDNLANLAEVQKANAEALGRIRGLELENERLKEALAGVLKHLSANECYLDHSGACQMHFLENPCSVAKARAILDSARKEELK